MEKITLTLILFSVTVRNSNVFLHPEFLQALCGVPLCFTLRRQTPDSQTRLPTQPRLLFRTRLGCFRRATLQSSYRWQTSRYSSPWMVPLLSKAARFPSANAWMSEQRTRRTRKLQVFPTKFGKNPQEITYTDKVPPSVRCQVHEMKWG